MSSSTSQVARRFHVGADDLQEGICNKKPRQDERLRVKALMGGSEQAMKIDRIISWVLALGFAAALVIMVGLPKFLGPSPNPIFALIEGRSHIGLFEPELRYLTGIGEMLAAILLIIPVTRLLGALLAGFITLSAIGFHLSPWLGVQIPEMGRLTQLLQDGRSVAEIDGMNLPTDGGALFYTALVFLAVSIVIVWLERRALTPHP